MGSNVCQHCGVEYPASRGELADCPICADDRVGAPPQRAWTTPAAIAAHHAVVRHPHEPGILTGIEVAPAFAIGQRAMLVETPGGCILFDGISLIDEAIAAYVRERGGLAAIVPSHPHFYGAMYAWSAAFQDAPIYINAQDRAWIPGAADAIRVWDGDTFTLAPGVTLVRAGGHFDGGTVLHVAAAAQGEGALLTGDVLMVTARGDVTFMRNYPGYVPLCADQIRHIGAMLAPLRYRRIYGAWTTRIVETNGAEAVARAVRRHLDILAA